MWPLFGRNKAASGGPAESLLVDKDSLVIPSPHPSPSPSPSPVTGNGVLVRSYWPDDDQEVNEYLREVPKYLENLPEYLSPEITPELSRSRTVDAHGMNYSSLSRFLWFMKHKGPVESWFLAGLLTSTADKMIGFGDFPVIGWAYLWARHLNTDNVTKQILCKKISDDVFVAIINIVKSKKDGLNDKYTGKLIFIDYTRLGLDDENPEVRVVDIYNSKSIVKTTDLDTLERTIGKSSRLYIIDPNSVKNNQKVLYVNGGKTISYIDGIVKDIYDNLPSSASTSAAGPASPTPSSARGGKRLKKTTSKNRKYRTMRKTKSRKHRHHRSKKRC